MLNLLDVPVPKKPGIRQADHSTKNRLNGILDEINHYSLDIQCKPLLRRYLDPQILPQTPPEKLAGGFNPFEKY